MFLRVWQDEKRFENGRQLTILNKRIHERLWHMSAVRAGVPCYLVMCIARDVTENPRQVQSFIDDSVFLGAERIDQDGDLWVEVVSRKPLGEVSPSFTG